MARTLAQKEDFIARQRAVIKSITDSFQGAIALGREYAALDLGSELTDDDFVGVNAGITKADFLAAIASLQAIDQFAAQGHATNLYKVRA